MDSRLDFQLFFALAAFVFIAPHLPWWFGVLMSMGFFACAIWMGEE